MKNIKELNSKIWYRLLKVTYILIFMLLLLFNTIIYKEFIVEQKIEQSKASSFTLDEYYSKLNDLKKLNPTFSDDEIWDTWLKLSKEKGYIIEWVDIDKELWFIISQKDNFISREKVWEILENAPEWIEKREIIIWLVDRWYNLEWLDSSRIKREEFDIIKEEYFISTKELNYFLDNAPEWTSERWLVLQLIDNWYTIEGLENYNPPELQKETKEIETTKLNMWFYSYSIILWKMFLYSFILYLVFFQLINRTFYYIVIWNFKPK